MLWQSCPWVGSTRGLGWGGLGWVGSRFLAFWWVELGQKRTVFETGVEVCLLRSIDAVLLELVNRQSPVTTVRLSATSPTTPFLNKQNINSRQLAESRQFEEDIICNSLLAQLVKYDAYFVFFELTVFSITVFAVCSAVTFAFVICSNKKREFTYNSQNKIHTRHYLSDIIIFLMLKMIKSASFYLFTIMVAKPCCLHWPWYTGPCSGKWLLYYSIVTWRRRPRWAQCCRRARTCSEYYWLIVVENTATLEPASYQHNIIRLCCRPALTASPSPLLFSVCVTIWNICV